jgi:hypothetical protein
MEEDLSEFKCDILVIGGFGREMLWRDRSLKESWR